MTGNIEGRKAFDMKEYLIAVTSENIKHYMIEATSNEEAISIALDYFLEEKEGLNNESNEIKNVKVNINSMSEIGPIYVGS